MVPQSPPRESSTPAGEQRRLQILEAAMACFARRGFHQTTMHDIGHEAGISVGLIYRYFESKEQVIAAMAAGHLAEIQRRLQEARRMPTLFEALETALWCGRQDAGVAASFMVDLFAEGARNPEVRGLIRRVQDAVLEGVADLVASSPEAARLAPGISPRAAAEVILQAVHGEMLDEILALDEPGRPEESGAKSCRLRALRRIWSLLVPPTGAVAPAAPEASHAS